MQSLQAFKKLFYNFSFSQKFEMNTFYKVNYRSNKVLHHWTCRRPLLDLNLYLNIYAYNPPYNPRLVIKSAKMQHSVYKIKTGWKQVETVH